MISVEQARRLTANLNAYASARWIVALHHHLIEYPRPVEAFSERIGTALINGAWFLRVLRAYAARVVVMHGHRHIDWIGSCGRLTLISAPSPVMARPDEATHFYVHSLAAGPDGSIRVLTPQRIGSGGQMYSCTSDDDHQVSALSGCACCRPLIQSVTRRINAGLSRRGFVAGMSASLATLGFVREAGAQPEAAPPPIVFSNFRLFDGRSGALRAGLRLLVERDRIKAIEAGAVGAPEGARVIDCGGRTIMPGLIDAHWHTIFAGLTVSTLLSAEIGYIFLAASAEAERTLMRGFTTVRDLGGPSFALKQAIDDGFARGPRIFPSGAMITTTGGHGDLRPLSDLPRRMGSPLSFLEQKGAANIADTADEVRLRVREQLLRGASQIKLMGGGGVSSPRTTLDMLTFSEPEMGAAVEAASDRNTYVAVHAYPPVAIRRALAAGVQCIEHGHLMDEPTAKLMAEKGVWLSTQPFLGEDDTGRLSGQSRVNALQVFVGTNTLYPLAKEHKIKTAFGSDLLFSSELAARQGVMITHLTRWYENVNILRMATSVNGDLLALSGPRNPYPGKLGVIEEDALADLLVVNGDPIADIALLEKPDSSLAMIMKGGRIYKNTVEG